MCRLLATFLASRGAWGVLGLLAKKIDKQALVAVCPADDSVALARIRRPRDLPPVLDLCQVHSGEAASVQGAEIARLARTLGLERYPCATTLSLGDYSLLFVEAPSVPPSELRAAVRWRIKDLIDFHIDDAVIDVFEVPNQRATGRAAMMYAVVARASVIRREIQLLTGAGLHLDVIDIPELALRNVAALLPEDVAGVALLYLARRGGLITITRQGTLYLSRRIELGWEMLGSSMEEARPRLDRIVVEVQRSLDYYESHFMQPAVVNVVVAPLPEPLAGVAGYLGGQLGITARAMDINAVVDVDQPVPAEDQYRYLLAIGAALRQEAVEL